MPEPDLNDLVQVAQTETGEVIQTFPLQLPDEALAKRVRHRGSRRDAQTPHAFRLPEVLEPAGILTVSVVDEEPWFHTDVVEPCRGVPHLQHHPVTIGVKGRRRGERLA